MTRRRPLWLPASSFYVLAAAVTIAVFFITWGLLQEGGDETPWIPAGLTSSIILAGAVLLREVVLRGARNRLLGTQKQLDRTLLGVVPHLVSPDRPDKLTIERNSAILHEIRQKSEAARVLGSMANGHREVFEMCERYLTINSRELASVNSASPRLAALLKGKDIAEDIHRYHTLQWAEVEARSLGSEARGKAKPTEKIRFASMALSVVESALRSYPEEPKLRDSAQALNEFIMTAKISGWIEKAQRAAFRGNYKLARKHYDEALFFVSREAQNVTGHQRALERINDELEKLKQIEADSLSKISQK